MKTMQSLLAAASVLAAFSALAAPQPLGNPLRAAKGCQSLSAQETARCKKTEDYCTNKPQDRNVCALINCARNIRWRKNLLSNPMSLLITSVLPRNKQR